MPWCPTCRRYLSPPSVRADGTCPTCAGAVDAAPTRMTGEDPTGVEPSPLPWHLKLLAGAVALYLGYRAWQGLAWIIERF